MGKCTNARNQSHSADNREFGTDKDNCAAERLRRNRACQAEKDAELKRCEDEKRRKEKECKDEQQRQVDDCRSDREQKRQACETEMNDEIAACRQLRDDAIAECARRREEFFNWCCNKTPTPCAVCRVLADTGDSFCSGFNHLINVVCVATESLVGAACKAFNAVKGVVCETVANMEGFACRAFEDIRHKVCTVTTALQSAACRGLSEFENGLCLGGALVSRGIAAIGTEAAFLGCGIQGAFGGAKDSQQGQKIDHIFVLMLENRSYDHMLGLADIKRMDPVTGQEADRADGLRPEHVDCGSDGQTPCSPQNHLHPTKGAQLNLKLDPPHEFEDVLLQLTGHSDLDRSNPLNPRYPDLPNPFVPHYFRTGDDRNGSGAMAVECFTPDQVPVLTTLAREYAVCDRWFASMPGPTFPNRCFVHAASSSGLDDSPSDQETVEDLATGFEFQNGNLFDQLDKNGIEWRIFEGDELPSAFLMAGMTANAVRGRFVEFSEFRKRIHDPKFSDSYVFIEPHYGDNIFGGFECGNSQHPLDDVTAGEKLIKKVYEIIRSSPHWNKSMLVVLYDEHGGFYDHQAPERSKAPGDSIHENKHGFQFDSLGPRVPAVVISPWIPRGTIDHRILEHSSIPATVERRFGVSPMTRRDKEASDLLSLLSLDKPRADMPIITDPPENPDFVCNGLGDPVKNSNAGSGSGGSSGSGSTSSGSSSLTFGETRSSADPGPEEALSPDARMFLTVAARRGLSLLAADDLEGRRRLWAEYSQIKTKAQAHAFATQVRTNVRLWRNQGLVIPPTRAV